MAIKKYKPIMIAGVAVIVLVMSAFSANASLVNTGTFVDFYLKDGFPTGLTEEGIWLKGGEASEITGYVSAQYDPREVIFSSKTDILKAADGFANISAVDGFLNEITIRAPNYYFEDLIFGVSLTSPQGQPNTNTDLKVVAEDKSGATDDVDYWTSESKWVNGNNNILVLSHTGTFMKSLTITSQLGFETFGGVDQLKQVQISGVSPVPLPAAMLLLGTGLMGLVGARLRKKK